MNTRSLLEAHEHRPVPLRSDAPIGHQVWEHLLFAHWEVARPLVQALLPRGMVVDTRPEAPERAWLGIVPFAMRGIRPRFLPAVVGLSSFTELNLRTYVRVRGVPGVYFFSLDANSRMGVLLARRVFALNYVYAQMTFCADEGAGCSLKCVRPAGPLPPAAFTAYYKPVGPARRADPHSLSAFLTERYCVFSERRNRIFRSDIHHQPWMLAPAKLDVADNTLCPSVGLPPLSGAPHLLYARKISVLVWGPRVIEALRS